MEIMPKNIKSILCVNSGALLRDTNYYCYIVTLKNGIEKCLFKEQNKFNGEEICNQILCENGDYINGYKLVKMIDNKYAYIREDDHMLMPYRYDVATDFNKYGFAMVAKNGSSSWINRDFCYLNYKGEMIEENDDYFKGFEGWDGIFAFSDGNNPLSRMFCGDEKYGRTAYFDTNGEIKKFYQYDGTINKNVFRTDFYTGTDFDENDYAITDNFILLSSGFCISKEDIIKLSVKHEFINYLFDDAKCIFDKNEKNTKILKK